MQMQVVWIALLGATLVVATSDDVLDFSPETCRLGAIDHESGASEWHYSKSPKCVALYIAANAYKREVAARLPDYVKANRMSAVLTMQALSSARRMTSALNTIATALEAQAGIDTSPSTLVDVVDVDSCASSGRCSADWRCWTPEMRYDMYCTARETPFRHIDTPKCQRLKNECERASGGGHEVPPEGQRTAWFKADCFETVELGGAAAEIRCVDSPWCSALRGPAENTHELLQELDAARREFEAVNLRLRTVTAAAAP